MKYKEQEELVSDLRALADFYERPESIELPTYNLYERFYITHHEWRVGEDGKFGFHPNPEKSRRKIKRITRALGECRKSWTDGDLEVIKVIGNGIKLTFSVTREAVCKKVPTGNKIIHAATTRYIPETVEDEFEWVCEEVSLLK